MIVASEDTTSYQVTYGNARMETDGFPNICGNSISGFHINKSIKGLDPNLILMHDLHEQAMEKAMGILEESEENCFYDIINVQYRIKKTRDGCNVVGCAVVSLIYQDIDIGVE